MLLKVGAQGAPHHLKRDQPPWDVHFLGEGVNPPLQKALGSSGDCASGTLALTMRRNMSASSDVVRTYLPPSLNDRNNVVGNRHGVSARFSTVVRYLRRPRMPPSQTWRTLLTNHMEQMSSVDFFLVPTATFRHMFVFVVLSHARRRVLHSQVTEHPSRNGPCSRCGGSALGPRVRISSARPRCDLRW